MRRSKIRRQILIAASAAAGTSLLGASAQATNEVWNVNSGSTGAYWTASNSWSPAGYPGPSDTALFNYASGGSTVLFSRSPGVNNINISKGTQQFNLSGYTMTIGGSNIPFMVTGSSGPTTTIDGGTINFTGTNPEIMAGGGGGSGYLTIQGGAIINTSGGYLNAGDISSGGSGTILVTGFYTTVNVGNVYAGASAGGEINLEGGATINTGNFTVGAAASGSSYIGDSTININSTLALGGFISGDNGENGFMRIDSGGVVNAAATHVWNGQSQIQLDGGGTLNTGTLDLGGDSSRFDWRSGTLNITNSDVVFGSSSLTGDTLGYDSYSLSNSGSYTSVLSASGSGLGIYVGDTSSGSLSIFGATISASHVYVGYNSGVTGALLLDGYPTLCSSPVTYIGASGTGTLTMTDNAALSGTNMLLGAHPGASGTVNLSGSSINLTGDLSIAGFIGTQGGSGIFNINGGSLTVAGTTQIWANGVLALTSGTFSTGVFNIGSGSFSWTTGTFQLTNSDAEFGQTASPYNTFGSSRYTLTNGQTLSVPGSSNSIDIGVNTSGELDLSNGATITGGHLIVGDGSGQSGYMTINGAQAFSNTTITYVGRSGNGYLTLNSGAALYGTNFLLGANPGAGGTVNLNSGSFISLTGDLSVAGYIDTQGGSGNFNINNGTVYVGGTTRIWANGSISLVSGTFSTGALDTFNNSSRFYSNWTGGTVNLTNSGLTIGAGELGNNVVLGSSKALSVSGATNVDSSGALGVTGGSFTAGSLSLASGSFTSETSGTISVGSLTSSGSAILNWSGGSLQITSGNLTIGAGPLGTSVNVGSSKSLTVSGTTTVDGTGILNVTGGIFRTGGLVLESNALFNWSAGTINITGAGSSFGGSLTVPNGGVLQLDGSISDPVIVNPGGIFNLDANTGAGILRRTLPTVSLSAGVTPSAQMNILASANKSRRQFIVISSLAFTGTTNAWQGKVDLANNDMDVTGGSLSDITNQIKQAYNGGWNGSAGIGSSSAAADSTHLTALGVIQNGSTYGSANGSMGSFDGYSPAATDVLIKYTYYGDANLDGKVDGSDYSRIENGYVTHTTGWFNGDFNYDGAVDGSDYTLIDNAFNTQGAQISAQVAAQIDGSGTSAVPEPASLGVIALGAIGLLGRRGPRRR